MTAKGKMILVYVFFPLLGFPVYFVIANAIDSLFGEMQLITWLLFEPLSLLLRTILNDWVHSIPVMFAVFLGLLLPVHAVLARLNRLTPARFGGAVSAVMFIFSQAAGFSLNGVMANTVTVMLLAVLTGFLTRPRQMVSGTP
jgi:hypothetical protein